MCDGVIVALQKHQKACFGILDEVFPFGTDELRGIRSSCSDCPDLNACFQAALASPAGVEMRTERAAAVAARSERRGLFGFLKRWSTLKRIRQDSRASLRPGSKK